MKKAPDITQPIKRHGKPIVTLREWSVVAVDDGYTAPEVRPRVLRGVVFGHPNIADGQRVRTGPPLLIQGREVETRSTVYMLEGPPQREYQQWCDIHGVKLDPENPFPPFVRIQ